MIGTEDKPLRVAIVGSGPAGFYTAEHVLKHEGTHAEVDIFDRLPTPYGLVRFGVAPDHPKIKSVIRVYEKTAARPEFRFFGNVEVGKDITVDELRERYHAVVFAYGTATDRQLGIPGEDLPGSHPATEFVNWYNAHPDFADRDFDLSCERVVVIGNGNVAADVARMLALTRDELSETDTADHAIEAFSGSGVKEILVLGRRGPAQAAFTNPEVRELGEMVNADIDIDAGEMELDEISREWLDSDDADPTNRRNVEIFTDFSGREPEGKPQKITLRFLRSPIEIQGDGKVERIVVGKNELQRTDDGRIRAVDTGERETIECGMVLRSIGYKGIPIEGIPFDDGRGLIHNDCGCVHDGEGEPGARPLRRGLDQARPLRRDRHEQEGRSGDGRQALRGPRGRQGPRGRARRRPRLDRGPAQRAASPTTSPSRAGRRSTRRRSRRASRTAAHASSSAAPRRWSRPRRPRRPRPEPDG